MLFVCIIQWILLINSQISAQNIKSDELVNKKSNVVRREWPDIRFEDFYPMSGDGPIENLTETYIWTTIVTQIKASVWPTVKRVRISTPIPKTIRISSTPLYSCHKYWSQISNGFPIQPNSEHILDSLLRRSSIEYSGPSSSIAASIATIASSDISFPTLPTDLISISIALSSKSYITSKSVISSDRLSEHFSRKENVLNSSFETNSNSHSMPRIEASFTTQDMASVRPIEITPIYSSYSSHSIESTVRIESDKNSIYDSSRQSFSRSHPENPENMLSTANPFITPIELSLQSTSVANTLSAPVQTISVSKTIDRLQSSSLMNISHTSTTTPIPVPLCPESLQTQNPREPPEKRFENYLMRTVLNNTSNESIASIKARIEKNIQRIYIHAFERQYEQTDQIAAKARKLLSKFNFTNIDVKLWSLSYRNGSNLIHVIYFVKRDGTLIPYEDAFRTLSYISDDKYSQMIGTTVIEKVKPYNEIIVAKSELNILAIILISCSGLVLIICIIIGLVIVCKYRSEKRKWIDAFHSELNRVVPDNQIHWRTVSKHMDPKTTASSATNTDNTGVKALADNSSEFQYLRFGSDKREREKKEERGAKTGLSVSKGTQINGIEMQKQKVIRIAKLIDGSPDRADSTDITGTRGANEYLRTTFVTTKDIETKPTEERIPRIIEVQMSEQTEQIIKTIRSELNRFGQNSNSIPFIDDTQTENSIISNSSEA